MDCIFIIGRILIKSTNALGRLAREDPSQALEFTQKSTTIEIQTIPGS